MLLRPTALAITTLVALCGQTADAAETDTLEPVVITGSTQARRQVDAPYAISSVSTDELRSSGPLINLSEALARVPGIIVANRNNYAQDLQISSRGFGARAGFGVRGLRLYTDGIPATMPDGQGQLGHADLAGAERVEVLRGPFSALYGNSSGGVIAVFSKPIRERQLEVAVDAGSFGLRQLRAGVATPLDGGFELAANVSGMQIDGFRPQSDAERQLATVRLGWKGEQDRVTTIFSHQHQRADDPLGLDAAQFSLGANQTTALATQFNTRKTIDQDQLGANWTHRFADAGALAQSQLSAYTGTRSVVQYLAITPATQANARHGGGVVDFDRSYAGTEGRLLWHWDEVDLVTGLNIEQQRDDRQGYENFTGTGATQVLGVQGKLRRDELNRADSRDGFAQLDWRFASDWQASAGLRSGQVKLSTADAYLSNGNDSGEQSFHYTNPVLGLRWSVSPQLTLHSSAARGYESPTLTELAYPASTTATGFNSSLQAQTSRQFELGAKWRDGGLALDATLFAINTDHEIGIAFNQGGRSSFQNVGRTERHGVELASNWRITPTWRSQLALTTLSASYQDAFLTCTGVPCNPATSSANTTTVAAGNRIAGTQATSAYAELAWTPIWSANAETALEWRAAGRTAANDTNTSFAAGYGVANLRYRQSFPIDASGAIELLTRLDNITDRRYAGSLIVNDANGRYFEPAAPRSALVSLRYQRRW
ncbi:MAG: TonB-dependent receptor family protein [Leptothrix sp. (in: b-proteobacteria)]